MSHIIEESDLYFTDAHPDHWVARDPDLDRLVIFPAGPHGWRERQVWGGSQRSLRSASGPWMAMGTGWPGALIKRQEAGRRLKVAREARGLSQEEAAAMLDMSRPYLSDLENGKRVCAWTKLVEIVRTLGLDPRIILPELCT
jgi:DNA-binding XRE family transcriptional regulator